MLCGEGKVKCTPAEASASVGEGAGYTGGVVEVVSDAMVELGTSELDSGARGRALIRYFAVDDVDTEPRQLCDNFSPFPGYWSNLSFHPILASSPCSLLTPSFPPPFLPSPSPEITWISLIGDSNPRNLFSHLSSSFGTGPSKRYYERASTTKNGTVASVVLRGSTGTYVAGAPGTIVLT